MKKELAIRIRPSAGLNKSENETRPSISKQIRKIVKQGPIKQNTKSQVRDAGTQEPADQQNNNAGPQCCETTCDIPSNVNLTPYLNDIDTHITQLDKSFTEGLKQALIHKPQIVITPDMRKILIKWLIKVGQKIRIKPQTLHMCVQLIDVMLIKKGSIFDKSNFQLLGVTCLFISCKYNEIYTIESEKYVEFCDGIYNVKQLFQMESVVLLEMNFNLQLPNIFHYLYKLIEDLKITKEHQNSIKTFADLFILDFDSFNSYSKIDISVVLIYFTAKLYKLDQLKNSVYFLKNRIQPEAFKECFFALVTLFKKSNISLAVAL